MSSLPSDLDIRITAEANDYVADQRARNADDRMHNWQQRVERDAIRQRLLRYVGDECNPPLPEWIWLHGGYPDGGRSGGPSRAWFA